MSTTNKPVKTAARPGRTLAILALVLIAMTSLVFIQGAKSVRLGLDLRGGTSVTLQPRIAPGDEGKITSDAIDQAVSIIRQRVNSLGVAESEVSAQGSGTNRQIVISVPGDTGRRVVELVGQTAELRFRQVLASHLPKLKQGLSYPNLADLTTKCDRRVNCDGALRSIRHRSVHARDFGQQNHLRSSGARHAQQPTLRP